MRHRRIGARHALGLLLMAEVLSAPAAAFDLAKGPYLQRPQPDGMTVLWETRDAVAGHVRYGTTVALAQRSADSAVGTHHEITLTGLASGARYHYALYEGDSPRSETFSFTTDAGPAAPFRFVVYGDNRSDAVAHQRVVDAILGEPDLAFAINTGDAVSDGEQEDQWQEFFEIERELLARVPVYATIGNHEESGGEVPIVERLFAPPTAESGTEHYYAVRWGNAAFVVLDGHVEIEPWYTCLLRALAFDGCFTAEQLDFIAAAMQAARADAAIENLFVVTHAGPYSSKAGRTGSAQMRDLLPSFLDHGVKLIFSGHDHYFEHGLSGNGIDYVVTGGGGAPLYAADPGSSNFLIPHQPLVSLSVHHYVVVDVSGASMQVTVKQVDGTVIDRFTAGERQSCSVPVDCSSATPGACSGSWSCDDNVCRWICEPPPSCNVPADCPAPPAGFCPGEWRCSLHRCDWACTGGECGAAADCAGLPPLNDCPAGRFACTDEVCEWICPPVDAGAADARIGSDTAPVADAGRRPDAASVSDRAVVRHDSAMAPSVDAAASPPVAAGCGCQAGAGPVATWWLAAAVGWRRRLRART